MEVVNTTDVTPAEAIRFLIENDGLRRIVGTDACACFVVSRPINTPGFFSRLIENVASIDSTTRQQIAFVVFYGESTIYARASSYHEPYQFTEAKLHDVSFSHHFDDRFDVTYGEMFRRSPDSINRTRFADHMTRATDALMDYFQLRESSLPCIVFVDPKHTATRRIVSLEGSDPVSTMYSRVLSPLSDAFRDLQSWLPFQKTYDDLALQGSERDRALEFLQSADKREADLQNEVTVAERNLEHFSDDDIPESAKRKFEAARAEFAEINAKMKSLFFEINAKMKSLDEETKNRGKNAEQELELLRLKEEKRKYQQRMDAFRGDTYLKQLRNQVKVATTQLNDFLSERSAYESTLARIPDDITDSIQSARSTLHRHTEESSVLGYDWTTVCRNWPRDWTRWSAPVGPRAFGVVEHVLARVANAQADAISCVGETIEYDIALSFAGEDRGVAETIAKMLDKKGVRVFYDRDEEFDLWGRDLYEHLADIYGSKAHFCVMFLSAAYAAKRWTSHERRHAQARAFRENREYILPVRLDDTAIPGIPETIAYMDLRETMPARIVDAIVSKLGMLASGKKA